jgi:hypothetical protein
LVVGATDALGAHFDLRLRVVDGAREDLDLIFDVGSFFAALMSSAS